MPFEFRPAAIPGVMILTAPAFADDRGRFSESYKASEFAAAGIAEPFVQDNLSWSTRRGTVRGMHFQKPPLAQGKLVRCLQGTIFDVVADLRRGSPTEGKSVSFELDSVSGTMIWVPAGLAHGFQTLVDDCLVLYKTTAEYSPEHEAGICWDDPELEISWPVRPAILSPRDAALPGVAGSAGIFTWAER